MWMLWVVFNTEAEKLLQSVHIYYDSNKTRETYVHIAIQEYLCVFTKLFTDTRVSEDFQFRVPSSWNNRKLAALETVIILYIPTIPIKDISRVYDQEFKPQPCLY